MSRGFRLKQGEPVPEGIVRIAYGRIDHAVDELRGKTESTPEQAVHEARKDMKKLRALLRLVRGEIGTKTFRSESACFRDAGRELAGLEERYPAELPADATADVRQALEAHRIRTAAGARRQAAKAAIAMLDEARGRVTGWPLERDGFEALEYGLKRTYRRGRRDWRACLSNPSAENLHGWRKRVKDLWYHCSILQETWKPVMSAIADEAHELSDRLGDDHDLAVLLEWGAEPLEPLITRRRRELQDEAFAYGARLYADKPGSFVGRIERWWGASARTARAEAAHH